MNCPNPITWNLARAMEHLAAAVKLVEQRKDLPRDFRVELESVVTDLAGVRGMAASLSFPERVGLEVIDVDG